jgi:hypothetical protein
MVFTSRPQTAYLIEAVQEYPEGVGWYHYFCGPQSIRGAWCPNCQKPLLPLAIVDATDPRVDLGEMLLLSIPLMYCWRCGIPKADFYYRVITEDEIHIVEYCKGDPEVGFPYDDYPVFFPGSPCVLRELSGDEQRALDGLSVGEIIEADIVNSAPHLVGQPHQIGGRPFLLQIDSGDALSCPICGQLLSFFANIGNRCADPRGIVGYSHVQLLFHVCHRCSVVGARNRAD